MKSNLNRIFDKKTLTMLAVSGAVYAVIAALMLTGVMPRLLQSVLIMIMYYVILAVSLNLVVGFLGELSLGHAAFYAVGAYTGCIFAVYTPSLPVVLRFIGALVVGGASAALVGFLISAAILKLRGDYLAIVTLAFGEFVRALAKIIPITGRTSGLVGIPHFETKFGTFTAAYIVAMLTIIVIRNFVGSRHGRAVMAIRDNDIAAESVGININGYRVKVFTLASMFAGMAGVIFGFYKTTVEPVDFTYNVSIEVLVMVVLGGMGNIWGSVAAAAIIVALPKLLNEIDQYKYLIYAVVLITMMMLNSSPRFVAFKARTKEKAAAFFARFRRGKVKAGSGKDGDK